jgi:hypothetical protein
MSALLKARCWLFGKPITDDLGLDMRVALATLAKRALREGDFELKLYDCSIRDIYLGNWLVTVSRIPASVDTHPKGEDAKQASFMGSAVPRADEADAQNG